MGSLRSRDAVSGMFFTGFGALTVALTLGTLKIGSAQEMEGGFFPLILGAVLTVVGLAVWAKSARNKEAEPLPSFSLRPLAIIVVAVGAAAFLLLKVGLIVAIPVLTLIFSRAMPQTSWKEALIAAFVMTAFAYLIFIAGLGLRIPVLSL